MQDSSRLTGKKVSFVEQKEIKQAMSTERSTPGAPFVLGYESSELAGADWTLVSGACIKGKGGKPKTSPDKSSQTCAVTILKGNQV